MCHMENHNGNWMRIPFPKSPIQGIKSILCIIANSNIDFFCLSCIHLIVPIRYPIFSLWLLRGLVCVGVSSSFSKLCFVNYQKVFGLNSILSLLLSGVSKGRGQGEASFGLLCMACHDWQMELGSYIIMIMYI